MNINAGGMEGTHEDGEDVADGGKRDEHRHGLLRSGSEHVAHEERGDEPVGSNHVLLGDRGELGIGQYQRSCNWIPDGTHKCNWVKF